MTSSAAAYSNEDAKDIVAPLKDILADNSALKPNFGDNFIWTGINNTLKARDLSFTTTFEWWKYLLLLLKRLPSATPIDAKEFAKVAASELLNWWWKLSKLRLKWSRALPGACCCRVDGRRCCHQHLFDFQLEDLDIMLIFNLSFTAHSEKIMNPMRSAQRYLRGGFVFDVLCALPCEYVNLSSYGLMRLPPQLILASPFATWRSTSLQ
ncbi:hypothetical protein V7S43_006838 [Phytophthora oleae]|uniref:Uncharacterized protein n=1 Tax=Phytophthora oleae TaxID=2107226 RepID=A0ABD3FQJ8_9STRA